MQRARWAAAPPGSRPAPGERRAAAPADEAALRLRPAALHCTALYCLEEAADEAVRRRLDPTTKLGLGRLKHVVQLQVLQRAAAQRAAQLLLAEAQEEEEHLRWCWGGGREEGAEEWALTAVSAGGPA